MESAYARAAGGDGNVDGDGDCVEAVYARGARAWGRYGQRGAQFDERKGKGPGRRTGYTRDAGNAAAQSWISLGFDFPSWADGVHFHFRFYFDFLPFDVTAYEPLGPDNPRRVDLLYTLARLVGADERRGRGQRGKHAEEDKFRAIAGELVCGAARRGAPQVEVEVEVEEEE